MSAQTSVCVLPFPQSRKSISQVEVVGSTDVFRALLFQALFGGPSPFSEYTTVTVFGVQGLDM